MKNVVKYIGVGDIKNMKYCPIDILPELNYINVKRGDMVRVELRTDENARFEVNNDSISTNVRHDYEEFDKGSLIQEIKDLQKENESLHDEIKFLKKELKELKKTSLDLQVGRFYKNRKGEKVYLYYKLYNGFQGVIDGYDHYFKFDVEGKATDYISEEDGTTEFDIIDIWEEEE